MFEKIKKLLKSWRQPRQPKKLVIDAKIKPLYRHVQVIVEYRQDDVLMDMLNTLWINNYNGVIITRCLPPELMRKCVDIGVGDDVAMKEELYQCIPPLYCDDADIIEFNLGGTITYTVNYHGRCALVEEGENFYDVFKRKYESED